MKLIQLILFTYMLSVSFATHGEIYKLVTADGNVVFSDMALHDGYIKLEKSWKGWIETQPNTNIHYNRKKYRNHIETIANEYALPPLLIQAVIHTESHYNPVAESSAGAVGLMQLMPATATRYGVFNRKDPLENIKGGTHFISDLMKRFNNDLSLVLAAYNAGENAVKRYGNRIPPYPETQRYVKKVLSIYKKYEHGEI